MMRPSNVSPIGVSGEQALMAAFEENAKTLRALAAANRSALTLATTPWENHRLYRILREPAARSPSTETDSGLERVSLHRKEDKLRQQGARCMDCGVPFCHTGTLMSGMASAARSIISSGMERPGLSRSLQEALARLHKTNNFS